MQTTRVRLIFLRVLTGLLLASFSLAACGGGGGGASPPSPPVLPPPTPLPPPPLPPPPLPPPPPPPAANVFDPVRAAINASSVPDLRVMVGDENGVIFNYAKGNFPETRPSQIASATKFFTGAMIYRLVEQGRMSLSDNPQKYIPFWTSDPNDPRSRVTLEQLLAFTSGFNVFPTGQTCAGNGSFTLEQCVRQIYDSGVTTQPGTTYFYSPNHNQIAAYMAERATGTPATTLYRTVLLNPLGISAATQFPASLGGNPRFSGSLISTAADTSILLRELLAARAVTNVNDYKRDRVAGLVLSYRPGAATLNGNDWHYGLSFWRECDSMTYNASCTALDTISSPGAFGWTPWIDYRTRYWGLVAMEQGTAQIESGPSETSVALEQQLQPLIEAALASCRAASNCR